MLCLWSAVSSVSRDVPESELYVLAMARTRPSQEGCVLVTDVQRQ